MSEQQKPTDRLDYNGDLEPVIDRLCAAYNVGTPAGSSVIEVGYEDCNVRVETDQDKYLAKMFAKTRTADDIARYTTTMQKVVEAGVHHPELLTTSSGEVVYTDSGITLVLMRFIEGKTFFEPERLKGVLEGYWQVADKPADFDDKFELLRLRYVLSKITLRLRRYTWEQTDFMREKIKIGKVHMAQSMEYFNI